ncbi:MAG: DUF3667 domain-containing protein [bacterium]
MKCMNCGSNFETPYCGQCGQEAASGKITFAELRRTAMRALSLERGWLHTVVDLTLRPGKAVRDYLDGKRVVYIGPVRYAITLNSAWILIMVLASNAGVRMLGGLELRASADGVGDMQAMIEEFLQRFWTLLMLLSAPVYAGFSWLIFRSRGLSFAEHLTLNLFNLGQSAVIALGSALLTLLFPEQMGPIMNISFLVGVAYYAWLLRGVCARNAWTAIGGAIVVQLAGLVAAAILGMAGMAAFLLIRGQFTGKTPI